MMEQRTLQYVAESCGGELLLGPPEATVTRVCTDSRYVQAGDLFVALPGEKFDGHDFASEAGLRGAAALVLERDKSARATNGGAVIAVRNARQALGRLAARYRRDFDLPCIAVGGSNGKTSTKDLLGAVLGQKLKALKSEASFNNDIGVPLTLLNLDSEHQVAVLEVGTNHPGELAPLMWMAQPRFGVITSLGREHLEFFGDLAGVAEEEGWLAELLPFDGKLFVNGDSPEMDRVIKRTRAGVVRVGINPGNDWWAREVRLSDSGVTFWVSAPSEAYSGEYRINLLGRHQVVNALLALAVGAELGLSRAEIRKGLLECQSPKMRLQLREVNGVKVLDDAYNANADSMLAALQTLHDLPCAGRRIAVLGDMAEVGAESASAHAEIARRAAELGVEHLFAVGKMAAVMGSAARAASLPVVREFADAESATEALKDAVQAGDLVLVKASRAAHLERVGELLEADGGRRRFETEQAVPA
ncbi:MAG: UDP-N-acetylmuramoyl-tripeptide--D-alanyl-D-alanine ligase [Verrucomicrobia bacterium]|nr:UDP-N-acetylmuramoyl-tripeptide--D-alanyl-D-alanine ligase [Verrucomicrobiota bacterium]